jgi:small conductance mechanosensitive channel
MTLLRELAIVGREWLPFGLMLVLCAGALLAARHVVIVRQVGLSGAGSIVRQLIMLGLTALAGLVVLLALPVSDQARGQVVGLLGVVLTAAVALSSTSFIGNAMAGLMLRAVRNFRAGDFLEVNGHVGRVSEQGILHTEIQTEERNLTTLPNLFLVTNPVTVVRASGTIVSATVSLGYDVPRQTVETLLKQAVERAELAEPFVQVLELGDFSVSYRAAGFLAEVKHLITARSRLRAMMLDALHEGGVEIVSPTFMNQRQIAADRRFIPPRPAPRQAAGAPLPDETIPEALMFDKAEEAGSIEEARQQLARVAEEMASVKKARDGEADERRTAALDRKLAILGEQHERFADRLERMVASSEHVEKGS